MSKQTKNNDYVGVFDVDVLIERLNDCDVKMISFTDHNIINCEAYEKFKDKTDIPILIGIELDIATSEDDMVAYVDKLSEGSEEKIEVKPYHVIAIFRSDNYKELNQELDNMYKKISSECFKNTHDLLLDKKIRVTTFKYLIESFKEEDFFLIAHGNKDKGIVPPHMKTNSLEDAQFNILLGEISALEMKSNIKMGNAIEAYNKGFNQFLSKGFESCATSYVVFSDNHDCTNYTNKEISTWVKGGLGYETLRISFSDPESRIHTSNKPPVHAPYYVSQLEICQDGMPPKNIELSPYLNVIIGGRSSGKSLLFNTLLSLISNVPPGEKRLYEDIYQKFIDSESTRIRSNEGDFASNISLGAEVYSQERIIKLFENGEDLKKALIEFFDDFDESEIDTEEKKVERVFGHLKSAYREYFEARGLIDKGDRLDVVKCSAKSTDQLFEIDVRDLEVEYDIEYHDEFIENLDSLSSEIQRITRLKFKNEPLFTTKQLELLRRTKDLLSDKLKHVEGSSKKSNQIERFFQSIKEIYNRYTEEELSQELQSIDKAKAMLDEDVDDYRNYFLCKHMLRQACLDLEGLDVKVDDKTNETPKYEFITKLNLNISKERVHQNLLCDFMGYDESRSVFENILDVADVKKTDKRIKQKTGLEGKLPDSFDRKLDDFVSSNRSNKQYEIVEKGETPINTAHTSQGRQASIFLDVKLNSFMSGSDVKVLMIDQIEDNIDNKYVSETLVTHLRSLKKSMQVILVTHNPTIAIYGDAENIVICDQDKGAFTYKQGGLEDEIIRHEACSILDGGDVAFRNRMDKYRIEKVFNLYDGSEI
jgi:hypothetical protein